MEENKQEKTQEVKKLTYEQLETVATQLSAQNTELRKLLQEITGAQKRLDYLFKVLEYCSLFSTDFINECIAEIEQLIRIPKEETETKEETTKE